MRDELQATLDERDYAKHPLDRAELAEVFKGRDPRDYLNPKSPAFKALGLKGKAMTPEEALALMVREPNLIKRPLLLNGRHLVAGFDRDALRAALK